jgi:hypothetical protein
VNIFVLDTDPVEAARLACDQHVVVMPKECAQMLCAALQRHGLTHTPYKLTHPQHPCTLWAGDSRENFLWLCDHGEALVREHTLRYKPKHTHKSLAVIEWCRERAFVVRATGERTPFPQCMPKAFQNADGDVVGAYHRFYREDKVRFAKWRAPRKRPSWMNMLGGGESN